MNSTPGWNVFYAYSGAELGERMETGPWRVYVGPQGGGWDYRIYFAGAGPVAGGAAFKTRIGAKRAARKKLNRMFEYRQ